MSTPEFGQREDFYYSARAAANNLLRHPKLDTPEHPYTAELKSMLDYAALGILDIGNGVLHVADTLTIGGVVLVPTLLSDVTKTVKNGVEVTLADNLYRKQDAQGLRDVEVLKKSTAFCALDTAFINPMIGLSPWLAKRDPLTVGASVLHELDHAYWWWNRRTVFKHGGMDSYTGRAQMETSAYRLEQQVLFAHAPEEYDEEYGYISQKFANLDFSKPYTPRDTDRRRRAIRSTAFVNYLLDETGADVGKRPTPKVLDAMKAQGLI